MKLFAVVICCAKPANRRETMWNRCKYSTQNLHKILCSTGSRSRCIEASATVSRGQKQTKILYDDATSSCSCIHHTLQRLQDGGWSGKMRYGRATRVIRDARWHWNRVHYGRRLMIPNTRQTCPLPPGSGFWPETWPGLPVFYQRP